MEESSSEKRPPTRGILTAAKNFFQEFIPSREKPDSSQLFDAYHTLRLNLEERELLDGALRIFRSTLVGKDPWPLKPTPPQLQDEEYSLLTFSILKEFLPKSTIESIENLDEVLELTTPEKLRKSSGEVENVLKSRETNLWQKFCQKNNLSPENTSAKKHLEFINQTARNIFLKQNNQESINMAEVFQNIQQSRQELLPNS